MSASCFKCLSWRTLTSHEVTDDFDQELGLFMVDHVSGSTRNDEAAVPGQCGPLPRHVEPQFAMRLLSPFAPEVLPVGRDNHQRHACGQRLEVTGQVQLAVTTFVADDRGRPGRRVCENTRPFFAFLCGQQLQAPALEVGWGSIHQHQCRHSLGKLLSKPQGMPAAGRMAYQDEGTRQLRGVEELS